MSRRTDQRRAAVFALYQHDVTGRELDDLFERDASTFTRALAYAAAGLRARTSTRCIERHAKGWTLDRIAPLEKAIMRVALLEMLHPDAAPGDTPIPPEGAIDEAVETAKTLLRRRGARASSTASWRPRCARWARMARVPMSEVDTTTLDALVERLERAAEQLRSGDLSADAAAGAGRGLRGAGLAGLGRARAHGARRRSRSRIPGQDSLL